MFARDAMLSTPLVVQPATSLLEFVHAVLNCNQTTAVVVDDGKVVGIVSAKDVFQRILPHYIDLDAKLAQVMHPSYFEEQFAVFAQTSVGDVMTTEVDCAAPDDPIIHIVAMFVQRRRKTVPIVADGRYLGSVTRRSVLWTVTRNTPQPRT